MKKFYFFTLSYGDFLLANKQCPLARKNALMRKAESAIVNDDIPSAKLEASPRAKWSAIEKKSSIPKSNYGALCKNFNAAGRCY